VIHRSVLQHSDDPHFVLFEPEGQDSPREFVVHNLSLGRPSCTIALASTSANTLTSSVVGLMLTLGAMTMRYRPKMILAVVAPGGDQSARLLRGSPLGDELLIQVLSIVAVSGP
jgi:hypothetical protein